MTNSYPLFPDDLPAGSSMAGRLTTAAASREYILAGNATFTLRSIKTGTRYTFKVRRAAENADSRPNGGPAWFVSLLNGPDNEADYRYMGLITGRDAIDYDFRFTKSSAVSPAAPSAKAWVWFFNILFKQSRLSDNLECWHEGRCGRCGRKLTVPESVERGLGPECAGKAA